MKTWLSTFRPLILVVLLAGLAFALPGSSEAASLTEIKKLISPDATGEPDIFGLSVAIDADTSLVSEVFGGSNDGGAAFILQQNVGGTDNWGEVTSLTSSDLEFLDRFGQSVALSGDTAIVGASLEDEAASDAGAVYIFERDAGGVDNWGQVKKLMASDAEIEDQFGRDVAIDGDTVIVGANFEDGFGDRSGAAYVFERDAGGSNNWGEVAKLTASDAQADANFGSGVGVSGEIAVVGAYGEPTFGTNAGATYVFRRDQGGPGNWGEVKKLTASDADFADLFGVVVAVSGDTLAVGAFLKDTPEDTAGSAYIFERDEGGADNWGEVKKLTASDADHNDFFGSSVAFTANANTLVVGAQNASFGPVAAGAAYVFKRNQGGAGNWGEVTKLTASDGQTGDNFGHSLGVSGDRVIVGAYFEDSVAVNAGAAYIFNLLLEKPTATVTPKFTITPTPSITPTPTPTPTITPTKKLFHEARKLTASDAEAGDQLGFGAALSGDTAVLGAPSNADGTGAVYVYQRNSGGAGNWGEVIKVLASDGHTGDVFGLSVAVAGDTAIVGAAGQSAGGISAGAAYIYQQDLGGADNWGEVKQLTASDSDEFSAFGYSVAVRGDVAVVGARSAPVPSVNGSGAAYIFERNEGGANNWGEVKQLLPPDPHLNARFGVSVAVDGDTVVVGSYWQTTGLPFRAGAAYIYRRDQGGPDNWGLEKKLTASDAQERDELGFSVGISGDTVVAGANLKDAGGRRDAGAAYVFRRDEGGDDNWGEVKKLVASDAGAGDRFGISAAVSGDVAVIGAYLENTSGINNAGAAYVFSRDEGGAGNWGQVRKLAASDRDTEDDFGFSVSVSGTTAIVGADREDGITATAGAGYIFDLLVPSPTPTNTPPKPVGGIPLDADLRSLPLETAAPHSAPSTVIVAAIVAAASVVTFGGMAWHARRRRSP